MSMMCLEHRSLDVTAELGSGSKTGGNDKRGRQQQQEAVQYIVFMLLNEVKSSAASVFGHFHALTNLLGTDIVDFSGR